MNTSSIQLLQLDFSPRGDRSHSRQMGHEFVAAWQTAHPAGRVVTRDFGANPPPFVTEAWIEGAFTPPAGHSPSARAAMSVSNAYIEELLAANEILITTPIYNLSVPAALKAWIDQIVRPGLTFEAVPEGGYRGLVAGKRVRVLTASGADFRPTGSFGAYNFIEPYLRAIFGFIGITEVEFVYTHSHNLSDAARVAALEEAIEAARKLAVT